MNFSIRMLVLIDRVVTWGIILTALGAALWLIVAVAQAQTIRKDDGGIGSVCYSSGGDMWTEIGPICHSDPSARIPLGSSNMLSGSSVVTSTAGPFCPDDRTIVMTTSGYKCAKDLTDPK